ncbi:Protein flp [Seiridium cupressi]
MKLLYTCPGLFIGCCAASFPDAQQPLVSTSNAAKGSTDHASNLANLTPALEDYIGGVMQRWHIPGLAVAVIQDNETWAKGFGNASLPATPVTPDTLFFTGSTTKSFTAAAVSLLIDNTSDYSSIQWTTPISSLMPEEFVLSDEWASRHITIEDALSHRTGYPRHDLSISKTTEELVHRLRYLPLSAEPRAKFQYCNHMFNMMGYLVTKLAGLSLGEFFHTYLWGPMGMNSTFLGAHDPRYKASGLPIAEGYWYKLSTGEYIAQPILDESADEGAGSTVSSVLDYVKYLRVMMSEAKPMTKAGHRELKSARSFWDRPGPPFVGPTTYSLGWASGIFQDEQVWFHGGFVSTFRTEMLMIPSKDIGIVVMVNSPLDGIKIVLYRILYDLFNVEEEKRFNHEEQAKQTFKFLLEYIKASPERLYPELPSPPQPPTLSLVSHTGEYRDPGYGTFLVELECGGKNSNYKLLPLEVEQCHLRIRTPEDLYLQLYYDLGHKTGDYWIGWVHTLSYQDPEQPLAGVRVQFRVDAEGRVSQLGMDVRMEGEDVPLVWFDRVG